MQEALSCFSFSRIDVTLGPNKLGNIFWGLWHLDMFLPVCWSEGGFNAAIPSGWVACRVFGRFWVLFQTLITFLGQTTSLVCACHCCFCSAWVYSLGFHFNSCPGTSVWVEVVPVSQGRGSQLLLSAGCASPGSLCAQSSPPRAKGKQL